MRRRDSVLSDATYLNAEQINQMKDCEEIFVASTVIRARLTMLCMKTQKDNEAIVILTRASNKMAKIDRNKPFLYTGVNMTVKDVKRVFQPLEEMPNIAFKKL